MGYGQCWNWLKTTARDLYGGTVTLFSQTFAKLGIDVTFVDPKEPRNFAKAIKDNTWLLYIETIDNPKNDILQYEEIAKIAHDNNMPVICRSGSLNELLTEDEKQRNR